MKGRNKIVAAALGVCAALTGTASAHAANGSDWEWRVEPYVWGAGVSTDLRTLRPPTNADNETSFANVIEKIDGVFMIHAEGQNDRWGVMTDFIYLGLGDETQRRVLSTHTDLDARLLDLAMTLRLGKERDRGAELYTGLRYLDVDLTAGFRPDAPQFPGRTLDLDRRYYDFLAGARYTWALSDRWGLTASADASAGDTDGTWSATLMGQYRMKSGAWQFGYRYLQVRLGNSNLDTTIELQGPQIGYGFRF